MQKTPLDPWTWNQALGYSQGVLVHGANCTAWLAGQCSIDKDGHVVHQGDMAGQVAQAMDNLESVLAEGDLSLTDVVRFDVYTTDLRALLAAAHVYGARFAEHGLLPVGGILAEVSALAMPGLMVELVAVASR